MKPFNYVSFQIVYDTFFMHYKNDTYADTNYSMLIMPINNKIILQRNCWVNTLRTPSPSSQPRHRYYNFYGFFFFAHTEYLNIARVGRY